MFDGSGPQESLLSKNTTSPSFCKTDKLPHKILAMEYSKGSVQYLLCVGPEACPMVQRPQRSTKDDGEGRKARPHHRTD
ncbi:hypothetical protein E2C01_007474 [Portunus trituberculatus]|uniref:Uncharacterized protein n=1 Tax=Portunus trituberculatus TaxID=210409 RepID=A0A5B7D4B9_PORTR|nr:hypothetical protein [Portunus trituberculatus]